ncbi:Ig-like domain-containing protein [Arthrobacter sp. EpRS71]|uniref:Ig-like domain-containing protein n=1 Tax=Arthrobacter sp. EpRS71 TaxID=1743141 RepID=UPI000A889636|nr:Ig-like domain-containing protein [Arthrobacter sp. EpRS71]
MNNQLRPRTLSLAAALLAAVMAVLGLGLSALPASAEEIPDAEITLSTSSIVTGQWDQVDLTCEWSVPDNSQPGDTFTLQLPPELRWFGAATFDLDTPDGQTVATATANGAGLVVFTLTDFVALHPLDVGGTCAFVTQYSVDPATGGKEELSFVFGDSVIRVPVNIEPCTEDCLPDVPATAGKSMWWADPAQTEFQSILYMPPMASANNDVVVTDVPAAGMVIDCSQVTPRVGKVRGEAGNIVEPYDDEQYPATIDCTPQSLTVSWTGLPKGEHVEVFVTTKVSDPSLDVYENNGTVTISGEENPVEAQTRRSNASGTGQGTAAATPTPSPSTTTATPTPTPTPSTTTATPTPSPSTSSPVVVVLPAEPTEPAQAQNPAPSATSEPLANTGAQGQAFFFLAAVLLAVGSLLAFAGTRKYRRRSH